MRQFSTMLLLWPSKWIPIVTVLNLESLDRDPRPAVDVDLRIGRDDRAVGVRIGYRLDFVRAEPKSLRDRIEPAQVIGQFAILIEHAGRVCRNPGGPAVHRVSLDRRRRPAAANLDHEGIYRHGRRYGQVGIVPAVRIGLPMIILPEVDDRLFAGIGFNRQRLAGKAALVENKRLRSRSRRHRGRRGPRSCRPDLPARSPPGSSSGGGRWFPSWSRRAYRRSLDVDIIGRRQQSARFQKLQSQAPSPLPIPHRRSGDAPGSEKDQPRHRMAPPMTNEDIGMERGPIFQKCHAPAFRGAITYCIRPQCDCNFSTISTRRTARSVDRSLFSVL